nr:DUF1127 domain-containing protein [Salipiger mucosus]
MTARVSQRRAYRRTARELSSLTDRELNDIGVNRGDIARIADQAATDWAR